MSERDILSMLRDQGRRIDQVEVVERPLTALPFTSNSGLVSPYAANGTPYVAPVWRDCTPARLALSVYVQATNNGANYWTITLNTQFGGGAGVAQGSVNTSALAANQWLSLSLTTFTTASWAIISVAMAYLGIAKTGAPGNIYIAPALYVL